MSATATERADLERRLVQAEARAAELTAAQVRRGEGEAGRLAQAELSYRPG